MVVMVLPVYSNPVIPVESKSDSTSWFVACLHLEAAAKSSFVWLTLLEAVQFS